MGSTNNALNEENRNCIKKKLEVGWQKEFHQYDSYGNVIYNYKKDTSDCGIEKYILYDIDQRIIGSIEKQSHCNRSEYIFYDENNKVIKTIELIIGCCTICTLNYIFYNIDHNIEASIIEKGDNCSRKYEVYDKYNSLINRAELVIRCCENGYYNEFDQNLNRIFKIICKDNSYNRIFQIFDIDENEVDLTNKTLFNDGFTKIQQILILKILFHPKSD